MTSAHDPLQEPLRLLREASLPIGFEERLAKCLVAAQQRGNVARVPGRKRVLLLAAAIALPALAAAAGGYYVQGRSSAASAEGAPKEVQAKPLGHLPKAGFTAPIPRIEPAMPAIEKLPAPRSQEPSRPSNPAPKAEGRQTYRAEPERVVLPPAANAAPRIEALDPFASKAATQTQKPPVATPKGPDMSEGLRKATEQGTVRSSDASARRSRRDANANTNENRDSNAAQQARERVQARERKGQ